MIAAQLRWLAEDLAKETDGTKIGQISAQIAEFSALLADFHADNNSVQQDPVVIAAGEVTIRQAGQLDLLQTSLEQMQSPHVKTLAPIIKALRPILVAGNAPKNAAA